MDFAGWESGDQGRGLVIEESDGQLRVMSFKVQEEGGGPFFFDIYRELGEPEIQARSDAFYIQPDGRFRFCSFREGSTKQLLNERGRDVEQRDVRLTFDGYDDEWHFG